MKKEDLHVHLHGCLTASDLWFLGKDVYKKNNILLDWYAREYEKAWNRLPLYKDYWEKENGFELLSQDYLFLEPSHFDCFQACFNLIIALCPLKTHDFSIQEHIIRKRSQENLSYFEARTVFSPRFDKKEAFQYLEGLTLCVKNLNKELSMQTKLVFSLPREEVFLEKQYDWLHEFISQNKFLAKEIVGIDFAFSEENHPPREKKLFFKKFFLDNKKRKPIKVFYHVGESFRDKTLFSAIRWVIEAHRLGAHRLGHAIALGVDPSLYEGKEVLESASEAAQTFQWLEENKSSLKNFGYELDGDWHKKERSLLCGNSYWKFSYTKEKIEELRVFQNACQKMLKAESVVIETCPTSNLRVGEIFSFFYHPIRSFLKNDLSLVLGTDDPGIFKTSFLEEEKIFKSFQENSFG